MKDSRSPSESELCNFQPRAVKVDEDPLQVVPDPPVDFYSRLGHYTISTDSSSTLQAHVHTD
jgi:hypothetical protein